jgi:hypothetical protein
VPNIPPRRVVVRSSDSVAATGGYWCPENEMTSRFGNGDLRSGQVVVQVLNAFAAVVRTAGADEFGAIGRGPREALTSYRVGDRPNRSEPRARQWRPTDDAPPLAPGRTPQPVCLLIVVAKGGVFRPEKTIPPIGSSAPALRCRRIAR